MLKQQYAKVKNENLKIFGISKVKTLQDFVTRDQDVKKGNNRLPLNLARLHDEDVIKLEQAMDSMKLDDDDEIAKNLQHKQDAYRKQSVARQKAEGDDDDDMFNK